MGAYMLSILRRIAAFLYSRERFDAALDSTGFFTKRGDAWRVVREVGGGELAQDVQAFPQDSRVLGWTRIRDW